MSLLGCTEGCYVAFSWCDTSLEMIPPLEHPKLEGSDLWEGQDFLGFQKSIIFVLSPVLAPLYFPCHLGTVKYFFLSH